MTDFRALCFELAGWIERSTRHYIQDPDVLIRAYAALDQPEPQPQPPADGEVAELVAEIRHFLAGYGQMRGLDPENIYSIHRGHAMEAHITVSKLTRAAELLEQLTRLAAEVER